MKHTFRPIFILLALLGLATVTATAQLPKDLTPQQKLQVTQHIIDEFYVDPVDQDTLTTEAIKAMLKTLDPHSSYTTAEETKEFTQPLEGKFSGIGIQFNMLQDTVYVIQTIAGGPSEKVGIRPGDRIVSANDTILAGLKMKNTDVMKHLRGPKDTMVKLGVKRADSPELIEFRVVRDDIPIYSVDDAYMADPETGYIVISRFAEDTGKEVAEAIEKLRARGAKKLIVDLSNNGGGYLGAAFELASLFLPKGSAVVSTAGRAFPPATYNTEYDGPYRDMPLAVIVNQYSASASEIFSGAIQDHDRGVIVGRRTFGKGLVQRPFPFPDGSMIRLTTAHYYTPSGRSIQKHYQKGHTEEYQLDMLNRYTSGELWHRDSIPTPDSLRYETLRLHRPVYGGGGIVPDEFVPVDTSYYSPYYRDIMAKAVLAQYCVNYVDNHRAELTAQYPDEEDFQQKFTVSDGLMDGLIQAATDAGVTYNEEEYRRSEPLLRAMVKGLLARDLYEKGSYLRSVNPLIPDFRRALQILQNQQDYTTILSPHK